MFPIDIVNLIMQLDSTKSLLTDSIISTIYIYIFLMANAQKVPI